MNKLLLPLLPLLLLSCGGDGDVASGPGAKLYEDLQCRTCHGNDGSGSIAGLGPTLKGKGSYWNAEELDIYLTNPEAYAEGDDRLGNEKIKMPGVPPDMTREDRDALIAYTLGLMVE